MAFRHARTDDPSNASANTRTRILERLLIQHAEEGLELIELRRQMGKSGYVPTPHYWQNDGDGDDLSDDDGTFLLIGGMAPIDLAVEIVEAARQFTEETGEHKNYRVVAYRSIPQDPEEQAEDAFTFSLPASMFSTPEEIGHSDASKEQHDAMMAMTQQFTRQNETLFRMLMDDGRSTPVPRGARQDHHADGAARRPDWGRPRPRHAAGARPSRALPTAPITGQAPPSPPTRATTVPRATSPPQPSPLRLHDPGRPHPTPAELPTHLPTPRPYSEIQERPPNSPR